MSKGFLPISKEDMKEAGIEQLDFIYISGDAYVDHPSFGSAIISRILEAHGYKVGFIAQPDWKDKESINILGEPRLGFLVSAGNMDSMVNHYTVSKKRRKNDAYTPGGVMGKRPDYATIVYCNLIRQTYKNKPANCLIALDLANRMSFPPLLVMKHLYIVKGKPAWSGKFCISIINSCGLFSPLEFITTEKGCYAQATRLSTGKLCVGPEVTWDMFKYRAASFFAGTFCPEKLEGIPTVEEMQDVNGYEEAPAPEKVIITLED